MEAFLAAIPYFALAGAFFVLLKLGYYCLGLVAFRHPLTAGIAVWLVSGDVNMLMAAIFFELLWLDLFYVGTFVPPDGLFAYLIFVPLAAGLGLGSLPDICPALLLCLPFAELLRWVEGRLRLNQSVNYETLNQVIDARGEVMAAASRALTGSVMRLAFWDVMIYSLASVLLYGLVSLWLWRFAGSGSLDWVNWGIMLSLGAVGGLLSLRIPAARVCFGAVALVAGGVCIF